MKPTKIDLDRSVLFFETTPRLEPTAVGIPSPTDYRKARSIVRKYHQKVRTNHWNVKAREICDALKIKNSSAIRTIEEILSDEI